MSKPRFKPRSVWMPLVLSSLLHSTPTACACAPTTARGTQPLWVIVPRTSDDVHGFGSWNCFPGDQERTWAPASWVFTLISVMASSREWLNKSAFIMLLPFHSTENELIQSSSWGLRPQWKATYPHTWLKQLQISNSEILIVFIAHSSVYIIEMVHCQCGPNTLHWLALQTQNNHRINYFKCF